MEIVRLRADKMDVINGRRRTRKRLFWSFVMIRVLFWYVVEQLVRLPTFLLMYLHEMVMDKVTEALGIEGWEVE